MLDPGCGSAALRFSLNFFPLYDPVRFGRKADPNGDYIRKYVPALKNFPIQYIHEPWMAPEQIQRAAKCIVGIGNVQS